MNEARLTRAFEEMEKRKRGKDNRAFRSDRDVEAAGFIAASDASRI